MADAKFLTVTHLDRTIIARLFLDIQIDTDTGCWIWTGSRDRDGYGQVSLSRLATVVGHRNKTFRLPRLMFAWLVAPVPRGFGSDIPELDHVACDNPPCCNPAHLALVLHRDNIARSNAVSSINRAKTHCVRGHILPPTRHFPNSSPMRICRICAADLQRQTRRNRVKVPPKAPVVLTHCRFGHALPPKIKGTPRRCMVCHRAWERRKYAKRVGGITYPLKSGPRIDRLITPSGDRPELVDQPL